MDRALRLCALGLVGVLLGQIPGFGRAAWLGLRHWQSKGCFDLEIGSDEYFDCA